MRRTWMFIGLLMFSAAAGAQNAPEMYSEEFAAAEKFKTALKQNKREEIAQMIEYPLNRTRPLPHIQNPKQFLANWDDYFDDITIPKILEMKPEEYGWRGVEMGNGDIWFNKDKISALNVKTQHYDKVLGQAILQDKATLHPLANKYSSIDFACKTPSLHVRVQSDVLEKDVALSLFTWKSNEALSAFPKLAVHQGKWQALGSGGNQLYEFNKGPLRYVLDITRLCGEDCNHYFITYRNAKEVSREPCVEQQK